MANEKTKKKPMDRKDILALFKSLAQSQGFYGRVLRAIEDANEDAREEFWQKMEAQKFTDDLEVVLFMEC